MQSNLQGLMTMKVKFYYAENHKYTASDVYTYSSASANFTEEFTYSTLKYKDGIEVNKHVSVSMHDVLYIEVFHDDGSITIVPGLVKKFTVTPSQEDLDKVQAELDLAKAVLEKYRANKEAKKLKNAKRKKEQYAASKGVSVEELEVLTKK